jgi:hypothetical protein
VVTRTANQAAAIECPDDHAGIDAQLQAVHPGRPPRRANRPEGPPAQVELGLQVIRRTEPADLQAAQKLTRAFP